MKKRLGFDRLSTFAALKASLQQYLGRMREPTEPKPEPLSFSWLRAPSDGWQSLLTVEGADVVVKLADGRLYVGNVVRCNAQWVTLELWGCGGQGRRFAVADVRGAAVVGPHGYREESEIKRRQRRGEPAHVEPRKQKAPVATKSAGASDS